MNRKTLSVCLVAVMVLLPQLAFAQSVVIEDEPDDDVITYTRRETLPSVSVPGDVVVGWRVPPSVQLRTIPNTDRYNYAVVNGQRVIVSPKTRKVIRIVE
ncbi:MAG: DUF1236 domain-containing protein [Rhodoplanes sp.]